VREAVSGKLLDGGVQRVHARKDSSKRTPAEASALTAQQEFGRYAAPSYRVRKEEIDMRIVLVVIATVVLSGSIAACFHHHQQAVISAPLSTTPYK
jgi:hypothetical protein